MKLIKAIFRILFPPDPSAVFSEENEERIALDVTARLSRGNTNAQYKRVTTQRKFEAEMKRMEQRVKSCSGC